MKFLLSKILMSEGKTSEAEAALQAFLKDYPTDANVPDAKRYLVKIEEGEKVAATTVIATSESIKPVAESPKAVAAAMAKAWASPDVDAEVPHTAPDVSCSAEDVIQKAQRRILAQLVDLEKFSATETVEHQVLDASGAWTAPISKEFEYLIFVHASLKQSYSFDERRNGGESLEAFPSSLATSGLATLGFLVLHPVLSRGFQFACEGLGSWNGKPAWQLHFVQRQDVSSKVRLWNHKGVVYPIPLKGRIWIAANSYNIVHLETALREPVGDLQLNRDQLGVDYGPVRFQSSKTDLWLPMQGEMCFELRGRRYHHKHTLTKYQLFVVSTKDKIKAPTVPVEPDDN
jgi:hypothetical protein